MLQAVYLTYLLGSDTLQDWAWAWRFHLLAVFFSCIRSLGTSDQEESTAFEKTAVIKKAPSYEGALNNELAMTYSHMGNPTLPSARRGFTSEFGKGSGGSLLIWSPAQLV